LIFSKLDVTSAEFATPEILKRSPSSSSTRKRRSSPANLYRRAGSWRGTQCRKRATRKRARRLDLQPAERPGSLRGAHGSFPRAACDEGSSAKEAMEAAEDAGCASLPLGLAAVSAPHSRRRKCSGCSMRLKAARSAQRPLKTRPNKAIAKAARRGQKRVLPAPPASPACLKRFARQPGDDDAAHRRPTMQPSDQPIPRGASAALFARGGLDLLKNAPPVSFGLDASLRRRAHRQKGCRPAEPRRKRAEARAGKAYFVPLNALHSEGILYEVVGAAKAGVAGRAGAAFTYFARVAPRALRPPPQHRRAPWPRRA
jgi:hypothetical protein